MTTLYLVKSNPVRGKEAEFNDWYTQVHMKEVLQVPGFRSAQRFELTPEQMIETQAHQYLALYEIDGEAVAETIAAIKSAGWMQMSDAMDFGSLEVSVFTSLTDRIEANQG